MTDLDQARSRYADAREAARSAERELSDARVSLDNATEAYWAERGITKGSIVRAFERDGEPMSQRFSVRVFREGFVELGRVKLDGTASRVSAHRRAMVVEPWTEDV
jgi:hypothetical protein